jgi:hypothetical protein
LKVSRAGNGEYEAGSLLPVIYSFGVIYMNIQEQKCRNSTAQALSPAFVAPKLAANAVTA